MMIAMIRKPKNDILFRNRLNCISFIVIVENNMLYLFCQTNVNKGQPILQIWLFSSPGEKIGEA